MPPRHCICTHSWRQVGPHTQGRPKTEFERQASPPYDSTTDPTQKRRRWHSVQCLNRRRTAALLPDWCEWLPKIPAASNPEACCIASKDYQRTPSRALLWPCSPSPASPPPAPAPALVGPAPSAHPNIASSSACHGTQMWRACHGRRDLAQCPTVVPGTIGCG